ncbi:MAG TPA: ATP-binding protein [Caulobacteraceae bacterium]|jgi:signal transduction histidine kinase/FixJ family two-component response regulator|nr:ATP-binding protein [Caulobacteraceae bacterium]
MPTLLGRVRDLRKVDRGLDAEVRQALIGALYASTGSLVVGAVCGVGVAVIVARYAADPWITVCAALISVVATIRVASALAYHRQVKAANHQAASQWERIYELGAWSYSALLGLLSLLTLLRCHSPGLHLVTAGTAIGYAGGICGRNAGRPSIAIAQLCLAALPVALGLLLWPDPLYRTLGVATIGFVLAMVEIVLQLYDMVRRAIVTTNEKRKAAEVLQAALTQAQAANRAKTSFLTTMSHEIRTPLNGVLGMAQTLAAEPLSPAQRDRVEIIRQSGETLLAILNDVLDLAKVEAGKLELEEAAFELGPVIRQAHAAFGDLARSKGLDYSLTLEPGVEGVYFADATRFSQIANNLISNAVKFTASGGVHVTARRRAGVLQLVVADTGIGISQENLDRIFEKFLQADASTTRRFGGTGLGLALSRELAGLMGGDIAVNSIQGKGSEFIFSTPMRRLSGSARTETAGDGAVENRPAIWTQPHAPAAPPAPIQAQAPAPQADVSGERIRILCAEDNEVNQMVLKTLLGQIDVEHHIVGNGAEALEAWEAKPYDIILMDVQMPVMDGPTAARTIRAREQATGRARTPIIALTANVMAHQTAAYLAAGMDEVAAKPINFQALLASIQRHLDGAAADGQSQPVEAAAGAA